MPYQTRANCGISNDMPSNSTCRRVELTREELYELVWSEAMTRIAARIQISDVALKKRCVKQRIPVPGRGYWRKVETGMSKRGLIPTSRPVN